MQFKRILGLVLVLSLSFVMTACGAGSVTPAPEATTATGGGDTTVDTTEDANDSGDTGSGDLSETASVTVPTGGTLTVNYPSGWTATPTDGAGTITLNSSDMSQLVNVTYYPAATGADAAAVMDTLATGFASAGTASEVTEIELGGKAVSSITVTTDVAGTETVTTYHVVTLEDGFALVTGNADTATLEAIVASASFSS
jgi:hypothetical protein